MPHPLYNETQQTRLPSVSTAYESLLGDSLERAYAQGIHDLQGVVARLNESGPSGPNGEPWTAESFQREMARLGI